MIVDGVRYSHLLDPRTGESFREGAACVSVAAPHCLVAGVTATIAMLHEESAAEHFLAEIGLSHLMVTQSGRITGTTRDLELSTTKMGTGAAAKAQRDQKRFESTTRSASQPSSPRA